MRRALLALLIPFIVLAPGCFTVAGGITGGALAAHAHTQHIEHDQIVDQGPSVGGSAVLGAGIGALVDVALFSMVISSIDRDLSSSSDWSGYGAWGGND